MTERESKLFFFSLSLSLSSFSFLGTIDLFCPRVSIFFFHPPFRFFEFSLPVATCCPPLSLLSILYIVHTHHRCRWGYFGLSTQTDRVAPCPFGRSSASLRQIVRHPIAFFCLSSCQEQSRLSNVQVSSSAFLLSS